MTIPKKGRVGTIGLHIRSVVLLVILLTPVMAHALPTPDVFVGLVNLVPLIVSTATTIAGGFYYALKDRVGAHTSWVLLLGLLVLVMATIVLAVNLQSARRRQRIENVAMTLRCDIAAHELWSRKRSESGPENPSLWLEYGNFLPVVMSELPELLRQQPDAALIATTFIGIKYHSGIPAVNIDGTLHPFSHVRSMELVEALAQTRSKDLYLIDFSAIDWPPALFTPDKSVFKKFEHIYLVNGLGAGDLYVVGQDGRLQQADGEKTVIPWPLEKEVWIHDERAIQFPGIATLLPNLQAMALLDRAEVQIVAPYTSTHRSAEIQEGLYLRKLLTGVSQDRIHPIDMDLPTTTQYLDELAKKLDGQQFLMVGLTKHDWLYQGLDAGFELWQRLGRDPTRFRLLGYNVRLPEVVAMRWEKKKQRGVLDILRPAFWRAVDWLDRKFHFGPGGSVLMLSVLLRLLVLPISYRETYSRLMRLNIKKTLSLSTRPLWSGGRETLMRSLGVRTGWELLGGGVLVLLVVPAYDILSQPPKNYAHSAFLWVADLAQPDYGLIALVAVGLFGKLHMGSSMMRTTPAMLLTICFSLFLVFLPSYLLVYVFGVLAVTLLQDLMAGRRSNYYWNRALLKTV